MRWFRNTIRQGTWLALMALVINLVLSFGHFHAIEGRDSEGGVAAAASVVSLDDSRQHGTPDGSHTDDLCPICMAATAMANALASAPPALPLEFAAVSIDRAIAPDLFLLQPPRAAFQPRGPPIS